MSATPLTSPAPVALGAPATTTARPGTSAAARRDSAIRRLLALSDGAGCLLALALTMSISGRYNVAERVLWGAGVLPWMLVLFKVYGLYDRDVKRMSHSTVDDIPWLFHAILGTTLGLWLYARVSPIHRLDFLETSLFGITALAAVTLARFAARVGAARHLEPEAALIVGGGEMARVLAAKLGAHPEYRSTVIGLLASSAHPVATERRALPTLGAPEEIDAIAARHRVTRIIISPGALEQSELEELLRRCRALSLKVSVLPQLSDVLGPAVEVDDVEGVTVLGVNPPWLPRSSRALKRLLDLLLAGGLAIALAPVMALIALAIKLDSPDGPVFFRQLRVGRRGRPFRVLKFRTMVADAEARRAALLAQSKDPNWLHLEHDPRITRVGRFLRLSSLDELPQLWNVIRGQMSMVGPRPLIEAEDEMVHGWARGRLDLTPGITGYWQVLGRTRIPFEEMVKLDYLYVMNWSLWGDLRLIMRTLPTVLGRRGAN